MAYPKRHPGTSFQPDRLRNKREQLINILVSKLKTRLNADPATELKIRDHV
jgi:hypothetical protein